VVIDIYIQCRELAINPPVISFSSIRDFDWGPVTIPLQIDGTAQSQRTDSRFSHLETTVWFLFDNESGLIAQYDITFRRLQWAIDYLKPFLKPQLVEELGSMVDNPEDVDDLKHLRAAIDVCREHELHCLGADQQYESTQACIDYIYNKIPLGEVCEWGGDNGELFCLHPSSFQYSGNNVTYTAMCRYIHKGGVRVRSSAFVLGAHPSSDMIQYRPSVHCPHIRHAITHAFDPHTNPQNSPSGGEMCIKRNVCVSSLVAVFHRANIYQQYINETTRKLYSAPFMPSLSSPS